MECLTSLSWCTCKQAKSLFLSTQTLLSSPPISPYKYEGSSEELSEQEKSVLWEHDCHAKCKHYVYGRAFHRDGMTHNGTQHNDKLLLFIALTTKLNPSPQAQCVKYVLLPALTVVKKEKIASVHQKDEIKTT